MKATVLLIQQHKEALALFKKLDQANDDKTQQKKLFVELASNLVAHDVIERELFYPGCEKQMGLVPILGESLAEHGLVEFSLYGCEQALGKKEFEFKIKALKDVLEHHIGEEQDELFPKVPEKVEALGNDMKARFDEVVREDYRLRLHESLSQVLRGALKTGKPSPKVATKTTNGSKHA
jgi:hypothetical protein